MLLNAAINIMEVIQSNSLSRGRWILPRAWRPDVRGVKRLCEWNGFLVFMPDVPRLACIAYPKFALVKGEKIRVNTREEFMQIYDYLEKNDPDSLHNIG